MSRDITRPQPGWWLVRLARNGPLLPACIRYEATQHAPSEPDNPIERPGELVAYIAGEPVLMHEVWERKGQDIDAQEYAYQLALLIWRRDHEAADPKAALDPHTAAPPF